VHNAGAKDRNKGGPRNGAAKAARTMTPEPDMARCVNPGAKAVLHPGTGGHRRYSITAEPVMEYRHATTSQGAVFRAIAYVCGRAGISNPCAPPPHAAISADNSAAGVHPLTEARHTATLIHQAAIS
jgi:hypothetical protein